MNDNERDLQKVVKYSSAFCLALGAGFVASIKQINPTARFQIDILSIAVTVLTGATVLGGWKLVFGSGDADASDNKTRGRRIAAAAALFMLATIGAFAFALKDLSPEKRNQVATGALTGLAAVAVLGTVIWRLIRFLEADYQRGLDEEKRNLEDRK